MKSLERVVSGKGLAVSATLITLLCHAPGVLLAEGIPEPGLVLYGEVRNTQGGQNVRLTTGTLVWTFQPAAGGAPVILTTPLTNLFDQFSYLLIAPAETELGGLTASSNVLKIATPSITYLRTNVTLDAQSIFLRTPTQGSLVFTCDRRGMIERVDLSLQREDQDSDGDGLPDWWESLYFVGNADPNADPDGDGMKNLNEYRSGTIPTDPNSLFEFIQVERLSASQVLVRWASVESKTYTLLRTGTLTPNANQFSAVRTDILATPPVNTFIDESAPGPGPWFYLLRVQ